jgi:hypothetical protein
MSWGEPDSNRVVPPWVLSPRDSVCVHSTPVGVDRPRELLGVERARRGDEANLELPRAATFTHDEIAQQPALGASVPGVELLRTAEREHLLAQGVRALRAELDVRHRDDLVEPAGGMEAADELTGAVDPERVLELVAVAPLLERRHDRIEPEVLEAPDAGQRVGDLLCLTSSWRS